MLDTHTFYIRHLSQPPVSATDADDDDDDEDANRGMHRALVTFHWQPAVSYNLSTTLMSLTSSDRDADNV